MPFKYDKLMNMLKEKGYTTYRIRKEKLIGQATLQKLQNNTGDIDTRTLERLCRVLECDIGDIMEYVDDTSSLDEEGTPQ